MSLYYTNSPVSPSEFFSQGEQWDRQISEACSRVEKALADEPRDALISESALRSLIGQGHAFAHIEDLKAIVQRPIKKDFILDAKVSASLNGYVGRAIRHATLRIMYHLDDDEMRHIGITISLGDLQREAGYTLVSQDVWEYVMANYPFPSFMNVEKHDNHAWTLWWYAHQIGVGSV